MITVAMPSYGNPKETWFTVQSLRLYQDVKHVEILVVDNKGDDAVKKVCRDCKIRYELSNKVRGTGPVRNAAFEMASEPFVLVMDSHVLLYPDAIKKLKTWLKDHWEDAVNLIHGPIVMSSLNSSYTHYENRWRGQMWGIWPKAQKVRELPTEPIEIEMHGCGLFGCRKDSWLGFHPDCKGFDGVEGVIHEKYRKYGRKVLCLPFLKWVHKFRGKGEAIPYPNIVEERVRNFLLGFKEIGMNPAPIFKHFGSEMVSVAMSRLNNENRNH